VTLTVCGPEHSVERSGMHGEGRETRLTEDSRPEDRPPHSPTRSAPPWSLRLNAVTIAESLPGYAALTR
jgi:hypothetical protein